jgi:hypothetical protein
VSIIIERTITIRNDQATLDNPIYLYQGDGDIVYLFTIKEMKRAATFGSINTTNLITENASYGEARIYKPDKRLIFTSRAEIIDDKLQVLFSYENIDLLTEVGRHQLQIHLYDDDNEARNRFTIPPIDINVLFPIGSDTSLIDEAVVGYSLLDVVDEEVPTFDEEGNYNKTEWEKGDIITKNKLNKIEDALYEINAADNNFITNEGLETALAGKANANHTHTGYATTNQLNNKANTNHTHNNYANINHTHSEYATKSDLQNIDIPNIPTRTSQLTNDSGYITNANVPTRTSQLTNDSGFITNTSIPTIPTKTSQLNNDSGFISSIPSYYITEAELEENFANRSYATQSYVTNKIAEAQLSGGGGDGSGVDLSGYATKDDLANKADKSAIPTLTSQLTNNSGFLTSIPFYYVTEEYLRNNKYTTQDYVASAIESAKLGGDDIDLTDYALKTEIPTIPTNVSAFTNDIGYTTESMVDGKIADALSDINVDVDLSDYVTNNDMNTALSNKADTDHTHDNYALATDIPTNVSAFENDKDYIASSGIEKITRIEIVTMLPETEEEGVLYIVKE